MGLMRALHQETARFLHRRTPVGQSILSLGAGSGEIEQLTGRQRILCVDSDPSHSVSWKNRGLDGVVADATRLPWFSSEQFGVVWSVAFLHHINEHIPGLLDDIHRVLQRDGILIIVEPNIYRLVGLMKPFAKAQIARHCDPNEKEIDPYRLLSMLEATGFKILAFRGSDFCLGPLAWMCPAFPQWLIRPLLAVNRALSYVWTHRSSSVAIVARKI